MNIIHIALVTITILLIFIRDLTDEKWLQASAIRKQQV